MDLLWYVVAIGAVIGIMYSVIEIIQTHVLIKQSRRTADVMTQLKEDPAVAGAILTNGIIGMSAAIDANPEYAETFYKFAKQVSAVAIQDLMQDPPQIPPIRAFIQPFLADLREDADLQREVFEFIAAAGQVAYKHAQNEVKEKVKQTIQREIPVPKKYRWLVELGERQGVIKSRDPDQEAIDTEYTDLGNGSGGLLPL